MLLLSKSLLCYGLVALAIQAPLRGAEGPKFLPTLDPAAAALTEAGGACFLTMAVQLGDARVVSSLLAGGYPAIGKSTLAHAPSYFAVVTNKADCFYLLLEAGIKDVVNKPLDAHGGWRLVSIAVLHDADRCVELALDYGAKVNETDRSAHRPLFLSIRHRGERSFVALLSRGGKLSKEEAAELTSEDKEWIARFSKVESILDK